MCLEVEQSFEEIDGHYRCLSRDTETPETMVHQKTKNIFRKIRPTDYRTFLKIRVSPNGRKVSLHPFKSSGVNIIKKIVVLLAFQISNERDGEFILEWIPFVLPKSKYGDLFIKFEYGHMRNGKNISIDSTRVTSLKC